MIDCEHWDERPITDLADFIDGYAFAPDDWSREGLPIIRIEQLRNFDSVSDWYSGTLPSENIIENGDLVFSWSASLFLKIWSHGKAALNQHLFKVVEHDGVDRLYLKYLIEYNLPRLKNASHGSTMQHVTRRELRQFKVKYPTKESEQALIAALLSSADKAIEQTEAMIAKQERIKTGLMQDLLTRGIDDHGNIRSEATHRFKDSPLGRIPDEWDIGTVNDFAAQVTDGDHLTPLRSESGHLLLSARNIHNGRIDLSEVDFVGSQEYNRMIRRCNPEPGDLLVSCSGSVGRVCMVPEWLHCALVRSVALIKFKADKCTSRWGEWFFRSWHIQRQIKSEQLQAAQPNLFQGPIKRLTIALPSRDEQIRITSVLDGVQLSLSQNETNSNKLEMLRTGLMQDLLSGKVPVTHLLEQTDSADVENVACPA